MGQIIANYAATTILPALATGIKLLGLAIAGSFWWLLAIVAVVTAAILVWKNWDKIKEWLGKAWDKIVEFAGKSGHGSRNFPARSWVGSPPQAPPCGNG